VTLKGARYRFASGNAYVSGIADGFWWYMDGRLVPPPPFTSNSLDAVSLELEPGSHLVEISYVSTHELDAVGRGGPLVVGTGGGGERPPLIFSGQHVKLEGGKDATGGFVVPEWDKYVLPPPWPPQGLRFDTIERDLADGMARANRQLETCRTDLLVAALATTYDDFRKPGGAPKRRVCHVRLPETHGGPRELNAQQVRILVQWLDDTYWGWYPFTDRDNVAFRVMAQQLNADQRNKWESLTAFVKRNREMVRELNAIASALEKAPE
jgi:hypothetical protein